MRLLFLAALLCAVRPARAQVSQLPSPAPESTSPGKSWQMAAPEPVGFSTQRLAALQAFLETGPTTAMMVTGRTVDDALAADLAAPIGMDDFRRE